jgi:dipeptidyl aminopeptidase/acylaminoacyl peptidase
MTSLTAAAGRSSRASPIPRGCVLWAGASAATSLNAKAVQKQVGTDPAKLKRDSPRQHATEFNVPVLLLHGDRDAQAPYAQSEVMDNALTHAGKPHRFVTIHDADHQLSAESDRVTMLREVEAFLAEHLGVVAP